MTFYKQKWAENIINNNINNEMIRQALIQDKNRCLLDFLPLFDYRNVMRFGFFKYRTSIPLYITSQRMFL